MKLALLVLASVLSTGCTLIPLGGGGDDTTSPPPGSDAGTASATLLAVDCRDSANIHDEHCVAPTTYGTTKTIGAGPHFVDTIDQVHRGFTDGNRIIAGLGVGVGVGAILAVDVTTGDRTVISGPGVGTGTALPEIWDVQAGPDGWYALAKGSVWRVDPKTGNRTKVWDQTTSTSCKFLPAADFTYGSYTGGFTVASDATIYMPILTLATGGSGGDGIIALKGTTCTLVSHTGDPKTSNRGTGPNALGIVNQMFFRNGELLILHGSVLVTVDPKTGNRVLVSNDTPDIGIVGSGPQLGDSSMAIGLDGKSAWTACNHAGDGAYVSVDLTTGDRAAIDPYWSTPLAIGRPWCTVWQHPTQPLLVVENAKGFTLFEPATGNANVLSY
jgi:hypothetical protein